MIYCYVCSSCGYHVTFNDNKATKICPHCSKETLRRDYKAENVAFVLTGDGFYTTDYRDTQKAKGSF